MTATEPNTNVVIDHTEIVGAFDSLPDCPHCPSEPAIAVPSNDPHSWSAVVLHQQDCRGMADAREARSNLDHHLRLLLGEEGGQ
ncbi:hypothetical protein [Prauserella endophytica]|uniref:Uncharacterized protein n=1 Tax=Prauserella endophytica TaxID=1592324 RepID=A0ABY2S142_9PSEU|nr:hypothetical protein [Prauserella endophytica]TKG66191.1 hypothetical protein FCN18_25460 [Prauserella endophytica]